MKKSRQNEKPSAAGMSYLISGIPQKWRLPLFGLLELTGMVLQFVPEFPGYTLLGLPIMIAGILPVLAKSYSNKPLDLGFEDWKPVTFREFERIIINFKAMKTAKLPFYFSRGTLGCFYTLLIFAAVGGIFISFVFETALPIVLTIDLAIIFYPVFAAGSIQLFSPQELRLKMDRFQAVLQQGERSKESLILTPYFRFDKDKEGRLIPEDVRMMVEPRRKPTDFMGVQIQVSINNGPSGAVPYMYAVCLTKGNGKSYNALKEMNWKMEPQGKNAHARKVACEPGSGEEYTYLVVRQDTESGGYHTTDDECIALFNLVGKNLRELIPA